MESVNDLVKSIKELVDSSLKDAEKSDKGNRQAGIRLRKNMLDIIEIAKDTRKRVIENRA